MLGVGEPRRVAQEEAEQDLHLLELQADDEAVQRVHGDHLLDRQSCRANPLNRYLRGNQLSRCAPRHY